MVVFSAINHISMFICIHQIIYLLYIDFSRKGSIGRIG